jgi:hypothetical protein
VYPTPNFCLTSTTCVPRKCKGQLFLKRKKTPRGSPQSTDITFRAKYGEKQHSMDTGAMTKKQTKREGKREGMPSPHKTPRGACMQRGATAQHPNNETIHNRCYCTGKRTREVPCTLEARMPGDDGCTHLCLGISQLLGQLRGMALRGTSQLVGRQLFLGNDIGQRVVQALPEQTRHITARTRSPPNPYQSTNYTHTHGSSRV